MKPPDILSQSIDRLVQTAANLYISGKLDEIAD